MRDGEGKPNDTIPPAGRAVVSRAQPPTAIIAASVRLLLPDPLVEALINAPMLHADPTPQTIVLPSPADSGRCHDAYPDVGENDEAPPTAFTPSQLFHSHESRKDP